MNKPQTPPRLMAPLRNRLLKALMELVTTLSTNQSTLVEEHAFTVRNGVKLSFFLAVRDLIGIQYDYSKTDGAYYYATELLPKIIPEQVYDQMCGITATKPEPQPVEVAEIHKTSVDITAEPMAEVNMVWIDGAFDNAPTVMVAEPEPTPAAVDQEVSGLINAADVLAMIDHTDDVYSIPANSVTSTSTADQTPYYLVYRETTALFEKHDDYDTAEAAAKTISEQEGIVTHILKPVAAVECVRSFKVTPIN